MRKNIFIGAIILLLFLLTFASASGAVTLTRNTLSKTNPSASTQAAIGGKVYTITLVSASNSNAAFSVSYPYTYPCNCVSTGRGPTNCLVCTSTNSTTQTIKSGASQTINGVTITLISASSKLYMETAVITISSSPNCIGEGGSLGAVVPGNYAQCCPGLIAYIPPGRLGTEGTCINPSTCKMAGAQCTSTSQCCNKECRGFIGFFSFINFGKCA